MLVYPRRRFGDAQSAIPFVQIGVDAFNHFLDTGVQKKAMDRGFVPCPGGYCPGSFGGGISPMILLLIGGVALFAFSMKK